MAATTRSAPYEPPPHGTAARYQGPRRHSLWAPCHCPDCRAAMRRTEKMRDLRRLRGRDGFQDRATVTSHLRLLLNHNWNYRQIADAAHISRKTVWNIVHGERATVRFDTAEAILKLVPAERPDGTISSVGTRRRAQALAAMGWPLAWTAEQVGLSYTGLRDISAGRTKSIQRRYHDAVRALYRTHAMRPGPSQVARRVALGRGWVTAAAWDEKAIDDPAATSDRAECDDRLTRNKLAALRRAEVEHLAQFNISESEIATRLDMALSTVQGVVRELRNGQRRDRKQAA